MSNPVCPKCHGEMKPYYGWWCPKCDKPEVVNNPTLNFLRVLYYLEVHGRPGIRNRLWDHFEYDIKNDSTFCMGLDVIDEITDEDIRKDLQVIKDTWQLGDSVQMYVSW